ncbi:MAG: hypothetical protein IT514_03330, partial [Burkholderiales bacterium]|nr:hypothetical protein [Burkholderiales bacterium]
MASSQAPRPDAPGAALPVRDKAAVVLALALVFIWSLPGTIALRMLLLLAALALVLPSLGRADWRGIGAGAKGPLLWLALLSAWLVFQALAISPESAWALSELRGQWLNALIALALGLALGWRSAAAPGGASRLATGIALALAALALIAAGQSLAHGLSRGELLRDDVPFTGGRLEMSFLLNLLFAFVLADLAGRATGRGRLLAMPAWAVGAILVLACLVHYLAGARNGILVSAVLALLALGYLVHARRERL